jgi:hypothetical protein
MLGAQALKYDQLPDSRSPVSVLDELEFQPDFDAANTGVAVGKRVGTLSARRNTTEVC